MPCSQTPPEPLDPHHIGSHDAVPAPNTAKTSEMMISRLNHTAYVPAAYASRSPLPSYPQGSLPVDG